MGLNIDNCLVMMVDIQEKLFPHIKDFQTLQQKQEILLKGVKALDLPLVVNEQYKKGLGNTIDKLGEILGKYNSFEKTTFSCCKNDPTLDAIKKLNKEYVVVFGIETHICVLQTCLDLLANGNKVVLVVDCVGSRKSIDNEMAIKRLIQAGVIPTTYESFLFEVLANAKHEKFKEISSLIK